MQLDLELESEELIDFELLLELELQLVLMSQSRNWGSFSGLVSDPLQFHVCRHLTPLLFKISFYELHDLFLRRVYGVRIFSFPRCKHGRRPLGDLLLPFFMGEFFKHRHS